MAGVARPFGQSAVLVTTGARRAATVGALAAAVPPVPPVPLVEVVGALDTVVLVLRPGSTPAEIAEVVEAAERWWEEAERTPPPAATLSAEVVEVPCRWDGADLADVGVSTGLGPDGVVDALTEAPLRVAFTGFAPGFAYLRGLPEALRAVQRRAAPRTVVPGGSVAVAGGFAGIYPYPTPGGWQLLGTTALRLFDPGRPPYARLRAGQQVRLRTEGRGPPGADVPPAIPRGGTPRSGPVWAPPGAPAGVPLLRVEDPGSLTLIQDAGRAGFAGIGVPAAGPADGDAHGLANRLVGNPPEAAALEVTVVGPRLRCVTPGYVALVGGRSRPMLDGRLVPTGAPVRVERDQVLEVGRLGGSPRATIAVAGGVELDAPGTVALGSTSTDTLSGLGPPALASGHLLRRAGPPGPMGGRLAPGWQRRFETGGPGTCTHVRVLPGPHPEWFPHDVLDHLTIAEWTVSAASDRVGLRLLGPHGRGVRRRPGELHSQGMVRGAVQVSPDGAPVVLLVDHATHGGYPVVAVVIDADISLAGRVGPGAHVRFHVVDREEAHRAWVQQLQEVASAVLGHFPARAG